jgi:hypothetical protein
MARFLCRARHGPALVRLPHLAPQARVLVGALAYILIAAAAAPAVAQTQFPDEAHVLSGWLAVSPRLDLVNVGWDDNVLRTVDNPQGDFTATFSPSLRTWLSWPRLHVSNRTQIDFVYFQDFSDFRSVDGDSDLRVEFLAGRVTPYVAATWLNARNRRTLEIDVPVRRVEEAATLGADVQLTGKTSIGVTARRTSIDYTGDRLFLGTDLAQYLDGSATSVGVQTRYAATPLTKVGVDVDRYETKFPDVPERDATGSRVTAVAEFQPRAQLTGRASFGIIRRTFNDGNAPPFEGSVANADLSYIYRDHTRFEVVVQRDLAYSYRPDQRDFLQTGIQFSVVQRLGSTWDVSGTVGRYTLAYNLSGNSQTTTAADEFPSERVGSYVLDVGRRFGTARVGFQVGRQTRSSEVSDFRGYHQMQITSSVRYGF